MSNENETPAKVNENTQTPQPSELDVLKDRARTMGIEFSNNIGLETLKGKIQEKLGENLTSEVKTVTSTPVTTPSVPSGSEPEKAPTPAAVAQPRIDDAVQPVTAPVAPVMAPVASPAEPAKPLPVEQVQTVNPLAQPVEEAAPVVASTPNPLEMGAKASDAENSIPAVKPTDKPMTLRQRLVQENMRLVRCRITNLDPKKSNLPGEIITVANEYIGTVKKFIPFGEATDNGYHIPYVIYKMLSKRKFNHINVRKVGGRELVEERWVKEFAIEVLPPLTEKELADLATAQIAAGSISDN